MPSKKRIAARLSRAALYVRVSTEEQAIRGVSIDAQRERLLAYAKENGLTVVDLYCDEGISARKRYTRRPELMRMLSDAEEGKIDVILFIKLDRWFRNIADYYEIQSILDRYGVGWIATEEDYDTTTANGRLSLNVRLAIAQDESDRTSERIKFVFENMVREKRVISGSTPLGFVIREKRLAVNEEEAEIVRAVFETYVECRSLGEAARRIETRFGKTLSIGVLRDMLTNTRYIGEAYGIADYCPAIVDPELFHRVGELLALRSPRHSGSKHEKNYLFRGVLFCGLCGKPLTAYTCFGKQKNGSPRREFVYYRCPDHLLGVCEMRDQWNEKTLEECLLRALCEATNGEDRQIEESIKKERQKPVDRAKILERIEKLKELYLHDLLPRELYEKDYLVLKEALKEESEEASADLPRLWEWEELYGRLNEAQKKAFWSRSLKEISVFPDRPAIVQFCET